jgi:hypothetical protein
MSHMTDEELLASLPVPQGYIQHKFQPHPDTLRDWFAGMAMQKMLPLGNEDLFPWTAELAYKAADAMMQARGEKP